MLAVRVTSRPATFRDQHLPVSGGRCDRPYCSDAPTTGDLVDFRSDFGFAIRSAMYVDIQLLDASRPVRHAIHPIPCLRTLGLPHSQPAALPALSSENHWRPVPGAMLRYGHHHDRPWTELRILCGVGASTTTFRARCPGPAATPTTHRGRHQGTCGHSNHSSMSHPRHGGCAHRARTAGSFPTLSQSVR